MVSGDVKRLANGCNEDVRLLGDFCEVGGLAVRQGRRRVAQLAVSAQQDAHGGAHNVAAPHNDGVLAFCGNLEMLQ